MDNLYYSSSRQKPLDPVNFQVSYENHDGSILHGVVMQLNKDDYQVYVKEKQAIIHCIRDPDGILSCKLNKYGNPDWVDGISDEVAKRIGEELRH